MESISWDKQKVHEFFFYKKILFSGLQERIMLNSRLKYNNIIPTQQHVLVLFKIFTFLLDFYTTVSTCK